MAGTSTPAQKQVTQLSVAATTKDIDAFTLVRNKSVVIIKEKSIIEAGGICMEKHYKYESHIPSYYNITTKLIDDTVEMGLGDKTAVYFKDKTYTYKEIQSMINRFGNALRILGVHIEERVILVMHDTPEALASFFGCVKIGAIPIPINYMYTADDYRFLLNNSRARTVVAHDDFINEIEGWKEKLLYLENTIVVGNKTRSNHISFHDLVDRCSDQLKVAYTTFEDNAFWLYTSGSTRPQGCRPPAT